MVRERRALCAARTGAVRALPDHTLPTHIARKSARARSRLARRLRTLALGNAWLERERRGHTPRVAHAAAVHRARRNAQEPHRGVAHVAVFLSGWRAW